MSAALHHVPQSRSFRTLWLLEELGEPFEIRRWSFLDGSLRSPEFLAVSPAGRVPALEIDGRTLFESGAICEYLCETRAASGLGRLPGEAERAEWLEWVHFAETIGQHLANLTQQHIALREDWMRSPTVMKLEARRLEKTLGVVERALEGRSWLLASGFSAADIQVGYGALIAGRFVRLEGLGNVARWVARFAERPAFRRALARDGEPEIYTREFYPIPEAG